MEYLQTILLGIFVTAIGAVPFGLVNLSVLETSLLSGNKEAMKIAHGAAWIEVIFGISAIFVGKYMQQHTVTFQYINYLIVVILGLAGIFYLLKKNKSTGNKKPYFSFYLKGVFLNLISLQVLLFWLLAITFLLNKKLFQIDLKLVLALLIGIWFGKIGVLWLYAKLSQFIRSKSEFLSKNINRIIGSILLITFIIQLIKI